MAAASDDSSDHRKLAFLIGNENYHRQENKLSDAINTIKQLENILKQIDFNVTTVLNSSKAKLNTSVNDFVKRIQTNDLILIYYYGHGYQVKGKNYIIPTDDDIIGDERDIEDYGLDVKTTFSRISTQNSSYVSLWILDCGRSYLLPNEKKSSSNVGGNGLCKMEASNGIFIQFAGAADQKVNNDLFTKHFLANIGQENAELEDIFQKIQNETYRETHQQQKPYSSNSLNQKVFLYEGKLTTERFFTTEKLTETEKAHFEACKKYYQITEKPLISVANEVMDDSVEIRSVSLKIGVDQDCKRFNLKEFLQKLSEKLNINMKDIIMRKIQEGSAVLEAQLSEKFLGNDAKIVLKALVGTLTDEVQKDFGIMKMFFMFLGPITSLINMQQRRAQIQLNPAFNRIYARGHDFWEGPNTDGKNRGGKPYFCAAGWQRWSFYVTDDFDKKFNGWCIGYHGTKFEHGLSIVLNGLKPAKVAVHGEGVYLSPSINYAAHPRYSEVKKLTEKERKHFFALGEYIQFVLECRIHPSNITTIARETLAVDKKTIDKNIPNDDIEWRVDMQHKKIIDFNDPNSIIVCTGILTRLTDKHPCFLPESEWWFYSLLSKKKQAKAVNFDFESLWAMKQNGATCSILYSDQLKT